VDRRRLRAALEPVVERSGLPGALDDLQAFLELLSEANERVNLVSRRSTEQDLAGHLAEALAGVPLLPDRHGFRLLDVGSGGGFPAIPLLLARRDAFGFLVESTGKKAAFLADACGRLGLTARVANVRFPRSLPKDMSPFDVMTSRAVADPLGITAAARPFLARGSRALLYTTRAVLASARSRTPHRFVPIEGSEQKGIAVVECFT
jgi:16S rRNA (guanine527-N7)-methyltransferase